MKYLGDPSSGSQAGTTASRNRFGQYKRTRAIPVQPRTPKQTNTRAQFTTASSRWRSLSDPQRTAWNDYAAQISYNDSLGSPYNPTGAALFVASSVANQSVGTVEDAPVNLPQYFLILAGVTYVDPAPGPEAFTIDIGVTDTSNSLLIETSGPVSPGITSAAAIRSWRSLPDSSLNLTPNLFEMTVASVPILTEYKRLFPSPLPGQTIWFRVSELFVDTNFSGVKNRNAQTIRFTAA